VRRLVAVAAIAALVAAAGGGAMPHWTGEQLVAGGLAVAPDVALNASGRAIAVWDDETGTDCATAPASLGCIHTVSVRDKPTAGAAWGGTFGIARPGVDSRPAAAIDGAGTAAVLWVHDIGDGRVVQAVVRDTPTASWPNAEDISKEVLSVGAHEIALDDAGDDVAVWVQRTASGPELREALRSGALRFWGAPRLLSAGAVTGGVSLAVTGGGDAVVVWIENGVVRAARGDLQSDSWGSAVPLSSPNGEAVGDPVVTVNARGDAVAVWQWRDRPTGQSIVQAAYDAAGASWTPAKDLGNAGAGVAGAPQAALDGTGNGLVTWLAPPAPTLQSAAVTPTGTWSRAAPVATRAAAQPRLATDPNGNALAVWIDVASATAWASARPAAPRAWQPPVTLSQAGASAPGVAMDDAGGAVAVWNEGSGGRVTVMGADLLGDWRPTLANTRPPSIVGKARAGRTLVCRRGLWNGTVPIRYAYAWLRNRRVIARARGSNYAVRLADRGARLACRVTATNAARSLSVLSASVRVRP
jgi:hypothetical protein